MTVQIELLLTLTEVTLSLGASAHVPVLYFKWPEGPEQPHTMNQTGNDNPKENDTDLFRLGLGKQPAFMRYGGSRERAPKTLYLFARLRGSAYPKCPVGLKTV